MSAAEIETLLRRGGRSKQEAGRALSRLISLGYVDDPALARAIATSLAARKGWGTARARQEMLRRGIDAATAEAALSAAEAEGSGPSMNLDRALAQALRTRGLPRDGRARDRLVQALMRRGFGAAEVRRAIGALAGPAGGADEDDWPEDDEGPEESEES